MMNVAGLRYSMAASYLPLLVNGHKSLQYNGLQNKKRRRRELHARPCLRNGLP